MDKKKDLIRNKAWDKEIFDKTGPEPKIEFKCESENQKHPTNYDVFYLF